MLQGTSMARKNSKKSANVQNAGPQNNKDVKELDLIEDQSDPNQSSSEDDSDIDLEALVDQTALNLKQKQDVEEPSTSSLFMIDTCGGSNQDFYIDRQNVEENDRENLVEESVLSDNESDDSDESDIADGTPVSPGRDRKKEEDSNIGLSSALDPGMKDYTYLNKSAKKTNKEIRDLILSSGKSDQLLKKSAIPVGMEKQENMPGYEESLNQLKKKRRHEREQSKGRGWFDMKAPEMTEDKKNDLMVLQMRRSLDPKRFYKAPDIRALPKYFEMGTVVENAADFYSSRIPKKQRKKTLVDELLQDQEFRSYNKRKYTEIQEAKMKGKGAYKHMKRLKKKKK